MVNFLVEQLLFAAPPLINFAAARRGVESWLNLEALQFGSFGLTMLTAPKFLLGEMINGELTPYHSYLAALTGCCLASSAIYIYMFKDSKDKTVLHGHYLARVVESSLIIMDNAYILNEGIHWNYRLFGYGTLGAITVLLGHGYFFLGSRRPTTKPDENKRINWIARLESYLLFISGLTAYAFPEIVTTGLGIAAANSTHHSLVRLTGALTTSFAFESYFVPEFASSSDKKKHMLGRLTFGLMELGVIVGLGSYYRVFPSNKSLAFFAGTNLLYSSLVLHGYLSVSDDEDDSSK